MGNHGLSRWLLYPSPVQAGIKRLIRDAKLGSYRFRYALEALDRPHYAHLVHKAASLASSLGLPSVSVIEFGVAGGNGLLSLEAHAAEVEKIFPVKIEVYGFDSGSGLPEPRDHRDMPYLWKGGFFGMDEGRLKGRLKRASLVLGDVGRTLPSFLEGSPAPIGAASFDLDFYSSTAEALRLFDAPSGRLLPRVLCYFDDIDGCGEELYGDFTGERMAISEFNGTHTDVKLSPIYAGYAPPSLWRRQMWCAHLFRHPHYGTFVGRDHQQLGLA